MELADTGATLGMDRFGLDQFNPTPDRIRTITALAGRGYADRMVLAHNANCFIDASAPIRTQPGQRSYPAGATRTSATMCYQLCANPA
jgi:predicted metal-dependent phosphotriesterase family hydrolase